MTHSANPANPANPAKSAKPARAAAPAVHPAGVRRSSSGRWGLGAAMLSVALVLAGCGGGGDVAVVASPGIGIDVSVAGSSYAHASPGQVLDVVAGVGQTIVFDANEPVVWSFSVNGGPLFLNGTTVDVGGVAITQVQSDPSRVVLRSDFYGPALLPIDVVLVATSTLDNAQVSTIRLSLQ